MAGERSACLTLPVTTMNDAQQIYSVFYAIFWGASFNVLPRWKPFNFGLIFNKKVKHISRRISLALFILNISPILYFIGILYLLRLKGNLCDSQWNCLIEVTALVLASIIPAFGIFGFYRIWLFVVESFPNKYYLEHNLIPSEIKPYRGAAYEGAYEAEPGLEKLGIEPCNKHSKYRNLCTGLFYILLGFLTPFLSLRFSPGLFIILISIIFILIFLSLFIFEFGIEQCL